MDKKESTSTSKGIKETAPPPPTSRQGLIGCPPWCSWNATSMGHQHYVEDQAEVVTGFRPSLETGEMVEVPLEVRHVQHSDPRLL